MRKILVLDDHFATGEQTIQPVMLYGPGRNKLDLSHVTKTASEALEYIKHVVPEPGKTQMLLLAMGGEEAYGPNRNGDGFPARPVPSRSGKGYHVAPGQELTKHYQSFETNPAHAFKHHQNKDASKASGVVKKAFWNDRMQRVELLVTVDNEKDAEWVDRVNDGEFPAVSMGCRIKYDVCSRCGNKAPTRAQYCDHAKFAMNQVGPDGVKNYVHNPDPSFFDISRVFRPADRTGYTLKKVAYVYDVRSGAELGELVDDMSGKSAAIRKLSDIDKIIRGEPIASASNLAPNEQTLIRTFRDWAGPRMADAPIVPPELLEGKTPRTVMATLNKVGMVLDAREYARWIAPIVMKGPVSAALTERIAAALPDVLDLYAAAPSLLDDVFATHMFDAPAAAADDKLAAVLRPYAEKRAALGEMLYRRLVPEGIRAEEPPRTDMLTASDPRTGREYTTTRGAAQDAQDSVTRANVGRGLGGAALLLGGYKLLGSKLPLMGKLPAAAAAGLGGLHLLRSDSDVGAPIKTDQGPTVPHLTEFMPSERIASMLDEHRRGSSPRLAQGPATVARIKHAATVDGILGLVVDFDESAVELGRLILA